MGICDLGNPLEGYSWTPYTQATTRHVSGESQPPLDLDAMFAAGARPGGIRGASDRSPMQDRQSEGADNFGDVGGGQDRQRGRWAGPAMCVGSGSFGDVTTSVVRATISVVRATISVVRATISVVRATISVIRATI